MKNEVVLMKKEGINAAFIGEEQQDQQVISTIRAGHIPLVYGNPEAILWPSWRNMLSGVGSTGKLGGLSGGARSATRKNFGLLIIHEGCG